MLVAYFFMLTSPLCGHDARTAGYEPISTQSESVSPVGDGGVLASNGDRPNSEQWFPSHAEVITISKPTTDSGADNFDRESRHSNEATASPQTLVLSRSRRSSASSPSVSGGLSSSRLPSSGLPWDAAAWDVPQSHTEPTSINTLLAATDPDDPGFVPPFRESMEGAIDPLRRRVHREHPSGTLSMREKLLMAQSLFIPFMVPLFLVYVA
jgi:hypothetical protein